MILALFISCILKSVGLTVAGVEVNYSDQSQLDLDINSKKHPNIKMSNIRKGVEYNANYQGIGESVQTSWDIPVVTM